MTDLLPFIIVGVVTGSLYGLAALGLVLTYRTSGIFNLAHGAIAAASAYLFYDLHVMNGWAWPLAALICLGVFGPLSGVVVERLARELNSARDSVVATVGLLLGLQGFLYVRYGSLTRSYPVFLPRGSVKLAGVNVTYAQIITIVVSVVAAAGLYAFLRFSRLGLSMRAVVDSPDLVSLSGTSPTGTRRASWMIGCTFAALSGILVAPTLGLDAGLLTLLVVQAFGAAAIGTFSSLPLTFAGGIILGVIASLSTKYFSSRPPLNALPSAVPFLVLLVVLFLVPARKFPGAVDRPSRSLSGRRTTPPALSRAGLLALGIVLVAVPAFADTRLNVYTNALILVMIFLSLSLLVTTSGQISLSHAAFAAVGATTFSHLTTGQGLPWFLALLGAGLVVVPVGVLLAVPAIRLSGIYLALATFGFGVLMQNLVYGTGIMFGTRPYISAPRTSFGPFDTADEKTFYFLVLAFVALACLAVTAVNRSRLGRLLRAMSESPTSLTTNGLGVNTTRVLVFGLSAFLAGIAGALFIAQSGQISRDVGFGPFQSLIWLAVLAVCGSRLLPASFLAATLLVVLPSYMTSLSQEWQTALFGSAAVVGVVLVGRAGGLKAYFARAAQSTGRRWARSPRRERPAAVATVASS